VPWGTLCWLNGRKIALREECEKCLHCCLAYYRCIYPEKCVRWFGEDCLVSEYGLFCCPEKQA